jgi:hypothetical protein
MAILTVISVLGGCKGKVEEKDPQTSASAVKSSTSVKTTSNTNTTSKSTAAPGTTSTTSTVSAKPSDSASTSATDEKVDTSSEVAEDDDSAYYVETGSGDPLEGMKITIDELVQHEGFDLGGRTITFASWGITNLPYENTTNAQYLTLYNRVKAAEKKYNFKMETKVETTNTTQYLEDITKSVMAGVKYADVVALQAIHAFPVFVKNNIIIPWNDYVDFEDPLIKANPNTYYGTRWEGKNYGKSQGKFEIAWPDFIWNTEVIEREGQPDILDLVESKQWNWGTLLEIAQNCTRDLNGDGVLDQWGIASVNARSLLTGVLVSNGIIIIDDYGSGFQFTLSSEPAQRALQFFSDLNFVHKVHVSGESRFKAGQAAMLWGDDIYF